jgi:hypothetical protein
VNYRLLNLAFAWQIYIEAAQQVFKSGPDLRNGLALFGIYTIADQNTAKFKDYFEAGAKPP